MKPFRSLGFVIKHYSRTPLVLFENSHVQRSSYATVTTAASTTANPPKPYPASTGSSGNIDVRPIAGSLGAEIHNVDLARPLTDSLVASLRKVFQDYSVIFFRQEAPLEPGKYLEFARAFGNPIEYPFVRGIEGYPEIINVRKEAHEHGSNFGGVWHSDTSYFPKPPMASILMALEVPPYGGDTLFANQYAAYEALSAGMKETLSGLRGVSTSAKADASKTREDRIKDSGHKSDVLEAKHPVVRTHPETGRKSLYVNVAHTCRFDGWTEEESEGLLKWLFQWQVKPEFTGRFRWKQGGCMAMWDNRCVLHNPINDYHGFKRSMLRITLEGETPV